MHCRLPALEVTKSCFVRANRIRHRDFNLFLFLDSGRTVSSNNYYLYNVDTQHKSPQREFSSHSINNNHGDDTGTSGNSFLSKDHFIRNEDTSIAERCQIEYIKSQKPSLRFVKDRSDQKWEQLHIEIIQKEALQKKDIFDAEQCMRWWISQCRAGVQKTKHERTRNNRYKSRQRRDNPAIINASRMYGNNAAKAIVTALDLFGHVVAAIEAQPELLQNDSIYNDSTTTAAMDESLNNWYDVQMPRATHLLNAILDAWRLCWIDLDSDNKFLPTPKSVFSLLKDEWSQFVPMNGRTYSIVMDAPVATMNLLCHKTTQPDVPIFCEEVIHFMLQNRHFSTGVSTLPDNVTYATALNAWARSGRSDAAEKAELLFNEFAALCSNGTLETMPNSFCYDTYLVALSTPPKEIYDQRLTLLKCATDKDQQLDDAMVSKVLSRERALIVAEDKFRYMRLCCYPNVMPNTVSFRTIIFAWAEYSVDLRYIDREKSSTAMDRAVALLYEMAELHVESGNTEIDIDYRFFGKLISTIALNQPLVLDNHTQSDLHRAEEIYHYMLNLYQRTRDERFIPDTTLLCAMSLVYAKDGRPLEAEVILSRIENEARSKKQLSLLPRISYYFDILEACMTLATKEMNFEKQESACAAADKAESIILRIIDIAYVTGIEKHVPSHKVVQNMLELWIACRMPQRAENYYRSIESWHEMTQYQELRWKPIHLRWLLSAWANEGNDSSIFFAQQAENILRELNEKYEKSRDAGFRPSVKGISLVVKAWLRTSSTDLIPKCKSLFNEAMTAYNAGNVEARPDVALYGSIFKAYSRMGDGHSAMAFLETMKNDYINNSNLTAKPHVGIYNMILRSWLKSTDINAPQSALEVFEMMQSSDVKVTLGIEPDYITFSILSEILAETNGHGLEEKYKFFIEQRHILGKKKGTI